MRTELVRRRSRWIIAPALAMMMLGAAACSGSDGASSNGTADPGTTTADTSDVAPGALAFPAYSDPNTPIYVALGRRFALKLESEPSEGYSWQVANQLNQGVLTPLGTQLRSESPGIPGAPAQQYISFAANGVGSAAIDVQYVSPNGQTATDPGPMTFNVTVTFDGQPPPPPPPDVGTTLPTR